jgi:hypothetical protein
MILFVFSTAASILINDLVSKNVSFALFNSGKSNMGCYF